MMSPMDLDDTFDIDTDFDYGWEGEDDGHWDDDPFPSPYDGNYSED